MEVQVKVLILQADGGVRPCCINAISAALADANMPMGDMVVACGVATSSNRLILDANATEITKSGCELSLACEMHHPGRVVSCVLDARMTPEELEEATDLAALGCDAVGKFIRRTVLRHMHRIAVASGAFGMT